MAYFPKMGGFHSHGGTPIAGWLSSGKIPIQKWMRTGGTPATMETPILIYVSQCPSHSEQVCFRLTEGYSCMVLSSELLNILGGQIFVQLISKTWFVSMKASGRTPTRCVSTGALYKCTLANTVISTQSMFHLINEDHVPSILKSSDANINKYMS